MTAQEKIEYTNKLTSKFSSYHSEKLFTDHHILTKQWLTNKST